MQVVYPIREGPFRLARSTFGHCPNSNWTPPRTQPGTLYIYTTRIIFTVAVATDWQRYADQESSSPRAHCKCNDPGICSLFVLVYLCLCSFLQWSRTRPWWRLSITWWRRRTRTSWTTPWTTSTTPVPGNPCALVMVDADAVVRHASALMQDADAISLA